MEEVSIKNGDIRMLLTLAYDKFSQGNLDEGIRDLEEALSVEYDNNEVVSSLKCANYWRDRFEISRSMSSGFEKSEYFMNQWKGFPSFAERVGADLEKCFGALKRLIFGICLKYYEEIFETHSGGKDPDILLRIGKCYKALGAYDKALRFLDNANQLKKDDPWILTELADSYALVSEMHISKAFFREAFFLNPQNVDLDGMESEMIRRLTAKVKEMGFKSPHLEEWIPVYGVLYGVFTVKRELRSIEYGKLRQAIYSLEVELREDPKKKESLMPRLLNRYFWLIDHFICTKESREKIDEVLLKIKELNPAIYEHYTK